VGTGTHTNPISQALIDEFVTTHNNARSGTLNPQPDPPLPPVSWDATLADVAYNYLSQCPGGNTSMSPHNPNATQDYKALGGTDPVGENIYASSGKAATPTDAVNAWMGEASKYDYDTNNIMAAGHYTQVVWRTSVRIGCAIVTCPNYQYPNTILCDYAPAGNYTNQKPY
jgi:pathogenesis-related protein 1